MCPPNAVTRLAPLLAVTAQDFRPVDVGVEADLDRLFGELRAILLTGQRLRVSVQASAVSQSKRPVLRCVDCQAVGHASLRYGGCLVHRAKRRQERLPPPRGDHLHVTLASANTSHLPTPPSSGPSVGVKTPTPVDPPTPAGAFASFITPAGKPQPTACSTPGQPRGSRRGRQVTLKLPIVEDGLVTPDWQSPGDPQGKWSPAWELQPLSPTSLKRVKRKFPWAYDPSLETAVDELAPDDLRLLWGAANTRGADPVVEDLKQWLWLEVSEGHDRWARATKQEDTDARNEAE